MARKELRTQVSELKPLKKRLDELNEKLKSKLSDKEWMETVTARNSMLCSIQAVNERYFYRKSRVHLPDINYSLNQYVKD